LSSTCTGAGQCAGVKSLDCDDGDVCTSDSCDPATGCVNNPTDASTKSAENAKNAFFFEMKRRLMLAGIRLKPSMTVS